MEMSDTIFEAFMEQFEEHVRADERRRVEAEDNARWEPIRQQLIRSRKQPPWAELNATWQAARQQRYDEADAARAAREHDLRESA